MVLELQFTREPVPSALADLVQRHGGSVSTALLDSSCRIFRAGDVDGAIGYRRGFGCAVAIGEPVCAEDARPALAGAFRRHCAARGWHTIYAVASERFAAWAVEQGYAAVAFGEELILDPRRDPTRGSSGRELRKKVYRAAREGLAVDEYAPHAGRDPALERALEGVARAWLGARRGPQIYLASVDLFGHREGRRWFYARRGADVVGVLSTQRLDARGGYLLDHHLVLPEAPIGTSEALVVAALAAFGREGCDWVTFGPAPAAELGVVANLDPLSELIARTAFRTAGRMFHLDARGRYRRKFQVARTDPSFLLFAPRRIGLRDALGVLRAFNVSLP